MKDLLEVYRYMILVMIKIKIELTNIITFDLSKLLETKDMFKEIFNKLYASVEGKIIIWKWSKNSGPKKDVKKAKEGNESCVR